MGALQFARVSYDPGRAYEIVNAITQWANTPNLPDRGDAPGLAQNDSVQLVAHLMALRTTCLFGQAIEPLWAYYRQGSFVAIAPWNKPPRHADRAMPVFGETRYRRSPWPNGELGAAWPLHLALALENCLVQFARTEQTDTLLENWQWEQRLDVGRVDCLLAPPAVTVVRHAVGWRYIMANLRTDIAYTANAADAYEARVRACEQQHRDYLPSSVENVAAEHVRGLVGYRQRNDWAKGAGTIAGTSAAVTLLGFIRSRAA